MRRPGPQRAAAVRAGIAALAPYLVLSWPGAAIAQDLSFSPAATEACLLAAPAGPAGAACIGESAARCIDTPPGGSTAGMGFCLGYERDYWDARLNAAYHALRAREAAVDAENARWDVPAPPREETLVMMQRAWIDFRDATCDWRAAQWGLGTGRGPAVAECQMQMTGRQALRLEAWLGDG